MLLNSKLCTSKQMGRNSDSEEYKGGSNSDSEEYKGFDTLQI